MSQCKIILENYQGNYYAGSEIRGRIECYFDEDTKVRGVKLRVQCHEHNTWTGTESYTDPVDKREKTRTITLVGDHDVLSVEQMLFGSSDGTRHLSRGRHVYPFSYHLPNDIPSSYRGPYGSISYVVKAIVDRPMAFDYEDEFIVVVTSPIDFNRMSQDLQNITTYSDEKSVCCWCCAGGNITVDVELPKTAFVAGETIPFKIHVTNLSNSNVEEMKVKFEKTITYKVTSPKSESKTDVERIVDFTEHGVGAHGDHTFNLELAIPNYIDVPNFHKCNLFKVSYNLVVSAVMPTCTLDLDIDVWDIKLGHVQCVNSVPRGDNGIPAPVDAQAPLLPQPGYPPPVYPPAVYPPTAPMQPGASYNPPVAVPGPPYPPNAPFGDNPKAREAAGFVPSAPMNGAPEAPPPSYSQVQQSAGFVYPPK